MSIANPKVISIIKVMMHGHAPLWENAMVDEKIVESKCMKY